MMGKSRILPAWLALLSLLASCGERGQSTVPLRQWAYVWQREWTPAVSAAIRQAAPKLDGFVVLGAEIAWKDGKPKVLRPPVDWAVLRETRKPIGIAMRIDPFTESATARDGRTRLFFETATSLVDDARQHGVTCAEFQVDYDCPEKRLAEYRAWLAPLRDAVKPVRLVITALPSWLDESEMAKLVAVADGFVLQVHSVPTRNEGERVALCDPERARRWVAQAEKFGRPFSVALPTYSARLGWVAYTRSARRRRRSTGSRISPDRGAGRSQKKPRPRTQQETNADGVRSAGFRKLPASATALRAPRRTAA